MIRKWNIAWVNNEIHLINFPGYVQIVVQAFAWLLSYEVVGTSARTSNGRGWDERREGSVLENVFSSPWYMFYYYLILYFFINILYFIIATLLTTTTTLGPSQQPQPSPRPPRAALSHATQGSRTSNGRGWDERQEGSRLKTCSRALGTCFYFYFLLYF
jgi:hypothetical protein